MAILIVEHNGTVEGASLSGRVLIGRRSSNHVIVNHPDVSRIHAWIDTAGRQFCVTDAGSRTGTFVNGRRVTAKVSLEHGDRITLGPAALTFRADTSLPAGVCPLNCEPLAPDGDGLLFDCTCGAPLGVPSIFAGKTGQGGFRDAVVDVPGQSGAVPAAAKRVVTLPAGAAPAAVETPGRTIVATTATDTCGACQSTIAVGEQLTTCPACGLTLHADCWAENYGCSAYGCSQVNILLPASENPLAKTAPVGDTSQVPAASEVTAGDDDVQTGEALAEPVPPEYLLLAGSVVGLLAGALTFGVPALLALAAALAFVRRDGVRHRGVAWTAVLLALAGVGVGVVVSCVWWLGGWSGRP